MEFSRIKLCKKNHWVEVPRIPIHLLQLHRKEFSRNLSVRIDRLVFDHINRWQNWNCHFISWKTLNWKGILLLGKRKLVWKTFLIFKWDDFSGSQIRNEIRFFVTFQFPRIRQPSKDHDHHFVVNISISKLVCGNFVTWWPMEAADQSTAWWLNICPTASTHSQFTIRHYFDFLIIKFWSKVTYLVIYHNQCQRVILMDRK